MSPYEPQPYAALHLEEELFFESNHEIYSAAFDRDRRIFYVTEFVRELEGRLVVHAWKVSPVSTLVRSGDASPSGYCLFQNHPNPFNPATTICFDVKELCRVMLRVYDVTGREVAVLVDGNFPAGRHKVRFGASGLPSGIYACRTQTGNFTTARKMIKVE